MWRAWWFRLMLMVGLGGGVFAVAWNYYVRSEQFREAIGALLSSDISRHSTEFVYTQLKEGRTVFRVQAQASTLTRAGEHQLRIVDLLRFDPDGVAGDRITAAQAVYRVERKDIEFQDNVQITLSDGTEISADWAGADLEREVVTIRTGFTFKQADITGSGGALTYSIPERRMEFQDGLRLDFPSRRGQGGANSERATYLMDAGTIMFRGEAQVWAGTLRLAARDIRLNVDESRSLREVAAAGKAEFDSPGEAFAGDRIHVKLAEGPDEKDRLTVLSGAGDRPGEMATPASFLQRTDGQRLTGGRIEALLDSNSRDAVRIETLAASDRVQLNLPREGLLQARSDRFRAETEPGGDIRSVVLAGSVELVRQESEKLRQELAADRLQLSFEAEGLHSAVATGAVRLNTIEGELSRLATAGKELRIDYREGRPLLLTAHSGCTLQSIAGTQTVEMTAERIQVRFVDGSPSEFRAEGDTRLHVREPEGVRSSQGATLDGRFSEGRVASVRQSGGFQMSLRDESSRMELAAQEGRYDVVSGRLSATGPGALLRVFDSDQEDAPVVLTTRADRIEVPRDGSELQAEGGVESVFHGAEIPVVVTSDTLRAEQNSGWAVYSGSPRLVQDQSQVSGERLRINRESREFIMEGSVDSLVVEGDGEDLRRYRVQAGRMERPGDGKPVVYRDQVLLETEGLTLQAPQLQLIPERGQSSNVERLVAEGGVEIDENGRKWRGRKATYLIHDRRLVVGD